MIKLVIFDLDGVLYDSKEYHFNALNDALAEVDEKYIISYKDHLAIYDGMPTNKKLEVLEETKGLDSKYFKQIWANKQLNTNTYLDTIEKNNELISHLKELKKSNIKLVCASNSIESTVKKVLSKLGIIKLFDMILSNEDVKNPKPHPEMYWKPMIDFGISPENTLVIEDSPIGRLGARLSSANTLFVEESKDLNSSLFSKMINNDFANIHNELNTYTNNKLNVLIPMAGRGSRFQERGYVFPKLKGLEIVYRLTDENGDHICLSKVPDYFEYSKTVTPSVLTEYQNDSNITVVSSTEKQVEEPVINEETGEETGETTTVTLHDVTYRETNTIVENDGLKILTQEQWNTEISNYDARQTEKRYGEIRIVRDEELAKKFTLNTYQRAVVDKMLDKIEKHLKDVEGSTPDQLVGRLPKK